MSEQSQGLFVLSTNAKKVENLFNRFLLLWNEDCSTCSLSPGDIIFALAQNLSKWGRNLKRRGLPQFLSRRHRDVFVVATAVDVVVVVLKWDQNFTWRYKVERSGKRKFVKSFDNCWFTRACWESRDTSWAIVYVARARACVPCKQRASVRIEYEFVRQFLAPESYTVLRVIVANKRPSFVDTSQWNDCWTQPDNQDFESEICFCWYAGLRFLDLDVCKICFEVFLF